MPSSTSPGRHSSQEQRPHHPTLYQTYGERSERPNLTPLATYLLRLIHLKKTNLCLSADCTTTAELLSLAEEVGDQICILKTHADIISDFTDRTARALLDVAARKRFVIFEDRKFGDIGNTVQLQYSSGPLSIVRWAQLVNAHLFPGPAIISALSEAARKAIAAHNSSVQTEISATPPSRSRRKAESVESETNSDDDEDYEDAEDSEVDPNLTSDEEEANSTDSFCKSRKPSVVSVSTTISTKTETISPQPSLPPSLSHGSSTSEPGESTDYMTSKTIDPSHAPGASNTDTDPAATTAALAFLGRPPFYRSLILLAEMSSAGHFFTPAYISACITHAREHKDFVMGFIAQRSLNSEEGDNFLTLTPGVQLAEGGDAMGQQYNTPAKVIGERGCDVMIVGRGIYGAKVGERREVAGLYRREGWRAYEERVREGRRRRS